MSEAQRKLQEARAAVEAARARLDEAQARETTARNELKAAHDALQSAREAADAELPGCVIVRSNSWKSSRTRGVIVGRTTGKTINVRPFGADESAAKQYRKSQRSGRWVVYPKSTSGDQWLEIDEAAGGGENVAETVAGEAGHERDDD